MSKLTPLPVTLKGKDISLVIGESTISNIKQALSQRAKMLGKVRTYEYKGNTTLFDRSNFVDPAYDLAEISRVVDIEPYIAQSVRKQREQILKEGYQITGPDQDMVAYVKQRLFEIALLTEIPTEQWIRELINNLITFHNGFLIIRRDENRSTGSKIKYFGKDLMPIAGIFVGDPTSMQVKVDKYGTPKRWAQKLINDVGNPAEKEFPVEDVIHVTMDRKPGYTFGTPYILPVLDDIRALRKLEELAITVISKEAFPLMHYKVGTPEHPAMIFEDGTGSEIDQVLGAVSSLPAHGYVVTSERHEITLISKQGSIIDMAPYIQYFESRVMAGLRLSPLDLGRGSTANKGTATNINQNLQDSAKDYQTAVSDTLTHRLIIPLLLEGGFDVTPDNMVRVTFETINKEEERAHQNHGLQMYMGNAIGQSEFRHKYLKMPPVSEEQKPDMFLHHQTEAQIKVVKSKPVTGGGGSSSSNSLGGVMGQIGNRAKPANQYGSKPKSKITANDEESHALINSLKTDLLDIKNIEEDMISEVVDSKLHAFVTAYTEVNRDRIEQAIVDGLEQAEHDLEQTSPDTDYIKQEIGRRSIDRFFLNFVVKSVWKTLSPYKDALYTCYKKDADGNTSVGNTIQIIESIRHQIDELRNIQIITAQRFGYIKFAKRLGHKTVTMTDLDDMSSQKIDITNVIYKNFMPKSSKDNAKLELDTDEKADS